MSVPSSSFAGRIIFVKPSFKMAAARFDRWFFVVILESLSLSLVVRIFLVSPDHPGKSLPMTLFELRRFILCGAFSLRSSHYDTSVSEL